MAKTIWVLIELENGKPVHSSLEVLGKAANMGRAEAIVLGAAAADVAPTLGEYGAEKVYAHADAAYDTYMTLPAVETLSNLLKQHSPTLLMLATTYELRDIAARLMVRNTLGLITDATDISLDGEDIKVTVPWGGENVVTAGFPQSGTGIVLIRPKAFSVERFEGRKAEVEMLNAPISATAQTIKVLDNVEVASDLTWRTPASSSVVGAVWANRKTSTSSRSLPQPWVVLLVQLVLSLMLAGSPIAIRLDRQARRSSQRSTLPVASAALFSTLPA
jgi:electron transfer flavoprotein alpha subunit